MTPTAAAPATTAVQVLVCGSRDRADDAAPGAAAMRIAGAHPSDVDVRVVGQLDVDDLLAVPRGAAVIVVDTALGVEAGRVVVLPLHALIAGERRIRPRSSHALTIPEVIGVADIVRGHPLRGAVIVVGGSRFELGEAISEPVARAIPMLAAKTLEVAELLRVGGIVAPAERRRRAAAATGV